MIQVIYTSYILGLVAFHGIDTLKTNFQQTVATTIQYGYIHICPVVTTPTIYVLAQPTDKKIRIHSSTVCEHA